MRDPHCWRSAHQRIGFTVKGQSWDVEWGGYEVFGTPAFWVNQTAIEHYEEHLAETASGADIQSTCRNLAGASVDLGRRLQDGLALAAALLQV